MVTPSLGRSDSLSVSRLTLNSLGSGALCSPCNRLADHSGLLRPQATLMPNRKRFTFPTDRAL